MVKTGPKQCQTGLNSAKQGQTVPNSAEKPLYSTPLGSPTGCSERSYVHVPVVGGTGVHDAQNGGAGRVGTRVGYTGVGTGWVIPGHQARCEAEARSSEAGPGGPAGPEWVGSGCSAPRCSAAGRTLPHHSLRSGPLRWAGSSQNAASGPIVRELTSFS